MADSTLFQVTTDIYAGQSIGMYYCGKRIHAQNHVYGPEIRDLYLFVLVNEGFADMYKNGEVAYRLKKKDMLVMCPGESICYRAKTPWSIQWIGLYGDMVDSFVKKLGISGESPIMEIKAYSEAYELLERMYQNAQDKGLDASLTQLSLIYAFFSLLFRERGVVESTDYISASKKIIEHNLNHTLSVEELAENLHLNPSYFSRIFASQERMTPKQYILEKKMSYAKRLLATTAASVKEIANSVGYSDPLYFSRLFRKKEHMSPTAYRESMIK